MSKQGISLLTKSVIASAALIAHRAVTAAGAHAAADIYGVANTSGAIGDVVPVDVIGTTPMEAGAAIPVGTKYVIADGVGRAIVGGTAAACLGRLVPGESASAAGQFVEVLLTPAV
ncbi:capsid cement protein [Herminiimonas arsenitoxidans]|uniref:capsid cement protein n=1 Tax=Herminiimonas arsenitoxidans TaxID=1809410 RepID=UPI0009711E43|nr:capsid cement protein [Herminiimonas arsenitoxidans]